MRYRTLLIGAGLALLCAPAYAADPVTELNITPWLESAKTQLMSTINQGGNVLFTILAALTGLGLVMRMLSSVTHMK